MKSHNMSFTDIFSVRKQLDIAKNKFKIHISMVLIIGMLLSINFWLESINFSLNIILVVMAAIFCITSFIKLRTIHKLYDKIVTFKKFESRFKKA